MVAKAVARLYGLLRWEGREEAVPSDGPVLHKSVEGDLFGDRCRWFFVFKNDDGRRRRLWRDPWIMQFSFPVSNHARESQQGRQRKGEKG